MLGADSKTDVVSASLTPVTWWGRQTSKEELTVQCGKCCEGRGLGPWESRTGDPPGPLGQGGVPEEVTPQLGPEGQR